MERDESFCWSQKFVNYWKRGNHMSEELNDLSQDRWTKIDKNGETLLHWACKFDDVQIFLKLYNCGLNIHSKSKFGFTPLFYMLRSFSFNILKVTITLGLLHKCEHKYVIYTLEDFRRVQCNDIEHRRRYKECHQVLVSNGFRYLKPPKSQLRFDQCREIIVTLLGLKKRKNILPKLDRFLVKQEVAIAIWTTRTNKKWDNY